MPREITEDDIRVAAYYIWEAEGRPEGRQDAHWQQARAELAAWADEEWDGDGDVSAEEAGVAPAEGAAPAVVAPETAAESRARKRTAEPA